MYIVIQSMENVLVDILSSKSIPELSSASLVDELSSYINELIKTDFPQLIQLLYRLDVSEEKLKNILKEKPEEDAGKIIASLMIERQILKLKARMQDQDKQATDTEERW
jgi:hypothetical protein